MRKDVIIKNFTRLLEKIHFLMNQADVDNTMPLRIVEYDSASYRKQVKDYMDANRQAGNEAYVRKLHKEQKLSPVVTIVLYYGDKWDGPINLSDMVDLKGREELRPYMLDYRINLVELGADRELYKKFGSDFRLIVKYLSARQDKKALEEFMQDNTRKIRHVEEFLDVMGAFGTGKRYEEIKRKIVNQVSREDITMYDIAEELENRGIKKGISQGISQGMDRFADLTKQLLSQKRYEDLERITTDEAYRDKLFLEYDI